ncbi:MAG TPA: hypothetical protein VHW60_03665 [Caulobacteraceae bacterium]|jgi:hypothetical protein|nr:hypothetical protein [Caulobacteraceae bacterium]
MNWKSGAARGAVVACLVLAGCQKAAPDAGADPAAQAGANTAAPPPVATLNTPDGLAAKAFLDGLYLPYKAGAAVPLQPIGLSADTTYDADLIALIRADPGPRQTALVFLDPLCQCGEAEKIQATTAVQAATPTTATASADFTGFSLADATFGQNIAFHLTFDLVKTPAGWRIHDIHTKDTPSLRDALAAEAKEPATPAPAAPDADAESPASNAPDEAP